MNSEQRNRFSRLLSIMSDLEEEHEDIYMYYLDNYDTSSLLQHWEAYVKSLEGDKAEEELSILAHFLKKEYGVDEKSFFESRRPRGRILKEARVDSDVAYVICSTKHGNKWWPVIFFKNMNRDYIGSHCEYVSVDDQGAYINAMSDTYIINGCDDGSIKMGTDRCDPEDVEEAMDKFYEKVERKEYTSVRLDDVEQLINLDNLNNMVKKNIER